MGRNGGRRSTSHPKGDRSTWVSSSRRRKQASCMPEPATSIQHILLLQCHLTGLLFHVVPVTRAAGRWWHQIRATLHAWSAACPQIPSSFFSAMAVTTKHIWRAWGWATCLRENGFVYLAVPVAINARRLLIPAQLSQSVLLNLMTSDVSQGSYTRSMASRLRHLQMMHWKDDPLPFRRCITNLRKPHSRSPSHDHDHETGCGKGHRKN